MRAVERPPSSKLGLTVINDVYDPIGVDAE